MSLKQKRVAKLFCVPFLKCFSLSSGKSVESTFTSNGKSGKSFFLSNGKSGESAFSFQMEKVVKLLFPSNGKSGDGKLFIVFF